MLNKPSSEEYTDMMARLYPNKLSEKDNELSSRSITFQVTDSCNLACTYCYQTHKGTRRMSFETAKKFVDILFDTDKTNGYVDAKYHTTIVLDFIGGEPLLEIDLIDQIIDYFIDKCIELDHPWLTHFRASICSNGVLYMTNRVQEFMQKHKDHLSFNITIDGNKELHDMCRVFPDGKPSYDIAIAGVNHFNSHYGKMGSKITIAPANVHMLANALKHMVILGYDSINANCVFEEGWTTEHAKILYYQMKEFGNWILDNNYDDKIYCRLYQEDGYTKLPPDDNRNWCGGTGSMLACDPDGYIYPCLRYMKSSLGDSQPPIIIGDVNRGICTKQCEKDCVKSMESITRQSQSTEECWNCPIGKGCAWCSAYNYQVFGTINKRATFICEMHKAEALANVYYWNMYYIKNGIPKIMNLNVPDEWALNIIDVDELNLLKQLSLN